jgi:hypothetical protein
LALISLVFVGSGALSLAVSALVVEPDEPLEAVIGVTGIRALGLPVAFTLASAAWLLFARRHASP